MAELYVGIDKFVEGLYPEHLRSKAIANYYEAERRLFGQQGSPMLTVRHAYWLDPAGAYRSRATDVTYDFGYFMGDGLELDMLGKQCKINVPKESTEVKERYILLTERTPGVRAHVANDLGRGLDRLLFDRASADLADEPDLAPYIGLFVGQKAIDAYVRSEAMKASRPSDMRAFNALARSAMEAGIKLPRHQ